MMVKNSYIKQEIDKYLRSPLYHLIEENYKNKRKYLARTLAFSSMAKCEGVWEPMLSTHRHLANPQPP